MKSVIIFYDDNSKYSELKEFDGKSAKELSLAWAESLKDIAPEYKVVKAQECGSLKAFLEKACEIAEQAKTSTIIFSFVDCPFLNVRLTKELYYAHKEYKAEYSFADGYPAGFVPEIIDAGTCKILAELAGGVQSELGEKSVTREGLFPLIKTDINSFEIETLLAPEDWRLYRFDFSCSKKESYMACKALYEIGKNETSAAKLSKLAVENIDCLKTVPAFYNLQLAEKCLGTCTYCPYPKCYETKNKAGVQSAKGLMCFEKFSKFIETASEFSGQAVIGLSAWGESFNHPELLKFIEKILSYEGLSVFIETDGQLVTNEFCLELKEIWQKAAERTNGWQKIMIAVSLDSFTSATYEKLRGNIGFENAIKTINMLEEAVPGCVYPQFVRMNENEEELENFFRYWNEKTNVTKGNFIIQKYNSYGKKLPESKPADLSPVQRNVCWHLRRDMTILFNGDVPLCNNFVLDEIIGNVFEEEIEEVWKKTNSIIKEQIEMKYCEKCRECDEWYTFNF